MEKRRVVVSGMGAVTPFGLGSEEYWDGLSHGRSAASLIQAFDVTGLPTQFAASVPLTGRELDDRLEHQKFLKTLSRAGKFALLAAKEAVVTSGFQTSNSLDPFRVGTSMGAGGLGYVDAEYTDQALELVLDAVDQSDGRLSVNRARAWRNTLEKVHPLTPLKALSNIPTAQIAITYNARGSCQTITTACTSSAQAVGEALRQIQSGIADVIIAGGSDSMVNPNGLVAFSALGVMSKNNREYAMAARPFDLRRDGFMLGEGAAVFVLEELEHCLRRGGTPLAELVGYASTCDAYRLTDEPPDAAGSVRAMMLALSSANVPCESVDYVNAHGTGTRMNDKTETLALTRVFRDHARELLVSSTKSMIGHLVAAAGAVELAACVLAMRHQVVPPTINYQESDPECNLDYVPNQARAAKLETILSNSFGFGGQNACLVIRRFA